MAREKEKLLTRKDVERKIKENDNMARGLDFSDCRFVEKIDLSDLDLSGIVLNNARLFRANFNGSILDGAIMQRANLQYATFNPLKSKKAILCSVDLRGARLQNAEFRETDLSVAQFQETSVQGVVHPPELQGKLLELLPAFLENTDFRGASLFLANFKGCYFYGTKLEGACIRGADIYEAHLEEAKWGNYIIGEERKKEFYFAEHCYRYLKMWYTRAGMYDIAGEFFFREMTVKRKALGWWPNPWNRALSKLIAILCGYGEKPSRVVISAIVVIFGLAIAYMFGGLSLPYSIYFSAVSFTALGYGSWAYTPHSNWVQGLGAFESFLGVSMMALFLVTFIRRMTR